MECRSILLSSWHPQLNVVKCLTLLWSPIVLVNSLNKLVPQDLLWQRLSQLLRARMDDLPHSLRATVRVSDERSAEILRIVTKKIKTCRYHAGKRVRREAMIDKVVSCYDRILFEQEMKPTPREQETRVELKSVSLAPRNDEVSKTPQRARVSSLNTPDSILRVAGAALFQRISLHRFK